MSPDPGYKAPRKTSDEPTRLTPNEQTCFDMLTEGKTRKDVEATLGMTRQRVSQLVAQVKAKGHTVPGRRYTRRTPAESGESSE